MPKKILFTLAIYTIMASCALALANNKPLSPFKDHLIILIHGINDGRDCFVGQARPNKEDAFYEYLIKPVAQGGLGCKDNVFAYKFSKKSGDILQNARELGDRSYDNPESSMSKDATGKRRCWIEQARYDYKTNIYKQNPSLYSNPESVPDNIVPSKCIFVVHSMGGLDAMAYILSDTLAAAGNLDKGFYENDVSKVVFIDSPMRGSEIPDFVDQNTIRLVWFGGLNAIDLVNDSFNKDKKWDKVIPDFFDGLKNSLQNGGIGAGVKYLGNSNN